MSPTAAPESIDVVVAADRKFSRQLSVTIAGVSHFGAGIPHRIFILHDGYDDELKVRVASAASDRIALTWINASSRALESAILPDYLPMATLYRLRVSDLLPADVHRVIYLDTDVVVLGSLEDLFTTELGETKLAAVRDAVCPWAASPRCLDWRELGMAPSTPYFNAGVMVIPLDDWRASGVGLRTLEWLTSHEFRYGDQCALNTVANGDWTPLPPRWNVQSGHFHDDSLAWIVESRKDMARATGEPDVVHFTSFPDHAKPWEPRSTVPYRDAWFDALDRTAWAGWRPDDSPRSRSREVLRRARRAGGLLVRGE